ncbi:MAG: DUF2306 domain-containing protein [Alphaproteobacteria bacterium]|jgi:uncharacterized membrane protein|nr:DUF2306 domain-containing protein [Alphaproteobacteria bacterium]
MNLDPILSAPLVIQLHVAAALPALVLGPFALFRSRRDRWHRRLGYAWVVSMLALAVSGFFIPARFALVGPFGPIHLLCPLAIWGVLDGVRLIRRGDVRGHRIAMQTVWFGAVGVTGLLTLVPGRALNHVLFGETPQTAWHGSGGGARARRATRKLPLEVRRGFV